MSVPMAAWERWGCKHRVSRTCALRSDTEAIATHQQTARSTASFSKCDKEGLSEQTLFYFNLENHRTMCNDLGHRKVGEVSVILDDICIGLHVNNIEGYYTPYLPEGASLTEEEIQFEKDADEWYEREGGYSHQQRTKPLTLAYGLNDSPIGLCAWIIEKFFAWSDCGGNIESVFTKDELLAHVTLYWVTETLHSSIRLYNESRKTPLHLTRADLVKVPVGVARFRLEDPFPPRSHVERGFNVQRWTNVAAGGHFASLEKPELLAGDIRDFFRSLTVD